QDVKVRTHLRNDSRGLVRLGHSSVEGTRVEGSGAPRALRGRLVLEEAILDGTPCGDEGVNCEQKERVGPKVDGTAAEKQSQWGSLGHGGLQRRDGCGAPAGHGILPCRPQRRTRTRFGL